MNSLFDISVKRCSNDQVVEGYFLAVVAFGITIAERLQPLATYGQKSLGLL